MDYFAGAGKQNQKTCFSALWAEKVATRELVWFGALCVGGWRFFRALHFPFRTPLTTPQKRVFLDNPTVYRSKSMGEKKAFGENVSAKTPRRNRKDPAPYSPRGAASWGDIPNQKAAGGGDTVGITVSASKRMSSSDAARGLSPFLPHHHVATFN